MSNKIDERNYVKLMDSLATDSLLPQVLNSTSQAEDNDEINTHPPLAIQMRQLADPFFQQVTAIMSTDKFKAFGDLKSRKFRHVLEHPNVGKTINDLYKAANIPVLFTMDLLHLLYDIEAVPNQSVWKQKPQKTCCFYVDCQKHPDAVFSFSVEPKPEGKITLKKLPDNNQTWFFKYSPAPKDVFSFTVTLTAKPTKGKNIVAPFEMSPLQELPPERIVFGNEDHTQPVPLAIETCKCMETDRDYTYAPDKELKIFNNNTPTENKPLTLKKINLVGETVVIDKESDDNLIYETYNNNPYIEEMEIIAEKVFVRSPFMLPQTNLTIYAKELYFEGGDALIKTTPLEISERADSAKPAKEGTPAMPGKSGKNGLNAGNITLHIECLHLPPSTNSEKIIFFDLTGGKGQDGGKGLNGVSGKSREEQGSASIDMYKIYDKCNTGKYSPSMCGQTLYTAPTGYKVIYCAAYSEGGLMGCETQWPINKNVNEETTKGDPPVAPGTPGKPGNGGDINSNWNIEGKLKIVGGVCGNLPAQQSYAVGSPGYPRKWIKLWHSKVIGVCKFHELERCTVPSAGSTIYTKDFAQKKEVGETGEYKFINEPFSWVHPLLLDTVLIRIKDNYLDNKIGDAETALKQYVAYIDAYKKSEYWSELSAEDILEINQRYDELQILWYRMQNNLDYFGNPAGWTPLLSFEVTQSVFEKEINRSAETLYYCYCIKNTQMEAQHRYDSLTSIRKQLKEDFELYSNKYVKITARLNALESESNNLYTRTTLLQENLQSLEEHFEQQAIYTATMISTLRLSAKIAGTIVTMLPVGQPATGIIGNGITLISDLDPNKPWNTIVGAADISGKYIKSGFAKEAEKTKNALKAANTKVESGAVEKDKGEWISTCNALSDSGTALSAGLKGIKDFINDNSASQDIIDAQMQQLKAQSPEFQGIAEQIEQLLREKQKFSEKIAATMEEAASTFNSAQKNLLSLEATKADLDQVRKGLDKKVLIYLENLERRVYDQLLKYHYYMAKAYEYRLLKPYTNKLDTEQLVKRLEKVAGVKSWQELNADVFKSTYTVVFTEALSKMANDIFENFSTEPNEFSCKLQYSLRQDEIDRLNNGQSLNVDFSRYLTHEENLRISNIKILMLDENARKGDITTKPVGSTYPVNAYIDLSLEHPAYSQLSKSNNFYLFRHFNTKKKNPFVWRSRYTPQTDITDPHSTSAAEESLLKSLLKEKAQKDMLLYCRPSVWSNISISKSGYPNDGEEVTLTHCTLELSYDYINSSDSFINITTFVTIIDMGEQSIENEAGRAIYSDMQPYFIVERKDLNNRKDARGDFTRVYDPDFGSNMTIIAQPRYGTFVFNKWTDVTGQELVTVDDTTLTITLENPQEICAQYISQEHKTSPVVDCIAALPDASRYRSV